MSTGARRRRDNEQALRARLANADELLTPAEVAALFRVDPKTVTRWAKAGRLTAIKTLGGHRRYLAVQIRQLLADNTTETADDAPAGSE